MPITKKYISLAGMQEQLYSKLKGQLMTKTFFNSDKIDLSISLSEMLDAECKAKNITEPIIYITATAYMKLHTLVMNNSGEVAWHGTVETYADNRYLITDVLVFPQEVTGATVVGTDNAYEVWLATQPDEVFDKLRYHGHSHVNMGVTPSAVDENYYSNLMTQVQDFYIVMITNKKEEITLRFYDVPQNICFNGLTLHVTTDQGEALQTWYDEVKTNIKDKVITYNKPSSLGYTPKAYAKADKKKEDTQSTKNMTNTITKYSSEDLITGEENPFPTYQLTTPEGIMYELDSLSAICTTIIRAYPDYQLKYWDIRDILDDQDTIAIDPVKGEIVTGIYSDEKIMAYAVQNCDLWEVFKA